MAYYETLQFFAGRVKWPLHMSPDLPRKPGVIIDACFKNLGLPRNLLSPLLDSISELEKHMNLLSDDYQHEIDSIPFAIRLAFIAMHLNVSMGKHNPRYNNWTESDSDSEMDSDDINSLPSPDPGIPHNQTILNYSKQLLKKLDKPLTSKMIYNYIQTMN